MKKTKLLLVCALVCVSAHQSSFAQRYEYLNLGNGTVSAINDSGQAAGSLFNPSGVSQSVLWAGGSPSFLYGPGGASGAVAINDRGQVAGYGWATGSAQAMVWSGGAVTYLAATETYGSSGAVGINDAGLVVGNVSQYYGAPSQAVVWSGFDVTPLTNAGGTSSVATGVNGVGQISGYIRGYPGSESPQAVVWQGGAVTVLSNLRTSNAYSIASAVNDNGVVVGVASDADSQLHAVFWRDGSLATLASLSSSDVALGVNNAGLVVGQLNSSGGAARAALWDIKTGKGGDLNAVMAPGTLPNGVILVGANGINDAGDIVGTSFNKMTGSFGAFELRAVPEASTWTMLTIGFVALFLRRRHLRSA